MKTDLAVKFLHNCSLYLITSHGVIKKSCAKVVEAPINKVDAKSNDSFLNCSYCFIYSYIRNYAAWAGMTPLAITLAPFQNLANPSSLYNILAVLVKLRLPPDACK